MMNLKYRKPEEMKDSGVEWVEKVPVGWKTVRMKHLSTIVTGTTPPRSNPKNYENGHMPWIKPDNIQDDFTISESQEKLTLIGLRQARVVPIGSAIVCCIGTIGKVAFADQDLTTNQQINSVIFDKHEQWLGRYGTYSLIASGEEHKRMSNRVVVSILNKSQQGHIKMPLPDILSQTKIADFLDVKTSRFDSIISKKEKLIEKLEEAKKSLISEVVTGKVKIVDGQMVERSPEEMKDSGVEWLGYIPRNWTFRKTSHDYEIRLGKMLQTTKKRSTDTLEEYLCTINVDWAGLKLDEVKQMWFSVKDKQQYLVKNGDLIVNEGGDAGKAVMVDGLSGDMYIQNAVHRVRPKGASKAKALYYWLFFLKSIEYIELICNKATIMHFTVEKFRNLPFLGQDYFEQKRMIDLLDARVPKINSIINKQRKIIEKIKQAKQSLIYEAVTGKIDLRDWEIKQEGE